MAHQNPIGTVVANYDMDHGSRTYGRGTEDRFFPDIERLDREAANKHRRDMLVRRGWQASSVLIGALVVAGAALFFNRRKARW